MPRFLLCAAMCLAFSAITSPLPAEDSAAPDVELTSALSMYQWLLDQGEERAAAKFAQALQEEFGGPWAALIVENARLRAELQSGGIRQTAAESTQADFVSEIEEGLRRKCSLHFEDAQLRDFLSHIAETNDLNIVVDEVALNEEGVTSQTPITIKVEDVMIKSVLQLVLQPLHLDFKIEDEVVKVSSRERLAGDYTTRVYAVADLVVPIPHLTPAAPDEQLERISGTDAADFDALIELITTTVSADSWEHAGGRGSVRAHAGTLSLVVRQSQQVHEEIALCFDQLRRRQNVQIAHTLRTICVPESMATDAMQIPDDADRARITLFHGQTGTVQATSKLGTINILISSAINDDPLADEAAGQTITVNLSAPESLHPGDVLAATHSVKIPNGDTAWVPLPGYSTTAGPNGEPMVLLVAVTSEIVTQEEEEELLGVPDPQ